MSTNDQSNVRSPHCDPSILHKPGECRYCDMYPVWQHYRTVARINFTGHMDDGMTPCPSEWFRPGVVRDLWGGNAARGREGNE